MFVPIGAFTCLLCTCALAPILCVHAYEIYATDFSTVVRNLEKHVLFVASDLWRGDYTVMVGSVYIPVFSVS